MESKKVKVILKKDSVCQKTQVNFNIDKSSCLNEEDNCFLSDIEYYDKISSIKGIDDVYASVRLMLHAVGSQKVNFVYDYMMADSNFDDLIPMFNSLLSSYLELCNKSNNDPELLEYVSYDNYEIINNCLKASPMVYYRILIKSIMRAHFITKLASMDRDKARSLYEYFLINGSAMEMFKVIGEPYYSISNGGMSQTALNVLSDEVSKLSEKRYSHLCWDVCPIKTCMECPKIKDRPMKSIDKYDFITDGFQTSEGIGKLVVTKCKRLELVRK